jgi:hypothetical protein
MDANAESTSCAHLSCPRGPLHCCTALHDQTVRQEKAINYEGDIKDLHDFGFDGVKIVRTSLLPSRSTPLLRADQTLHATGWVWTAKKSNVVRADIVLYYARVIVDPRSDCSVLQICGADARERQELRECLQLCICMCLALTTVPPVLCDRR